MKWIIRI